MASIDSLRARPVGRQLVDLGRRGGLVLRVVVSRWQLDEELAAGIDPHSRPVLALRSAQLLRPRFRRRLASRVERLIDEVDTRGPVYSAAVPIQRDEVALARGALLALADELRTAQAIQPRGVAMVWKLLTDSGDSPLYVRTERGAVQLQIETARVCLLGGNGTYERWSSQRSGPAAERRSRHAGSA